MKTRHILLLLSVCGIWFAGTGCSSDGGGSSTHISTGFYYGTGFYDPWYYGGYYDDIDVIVTPPDRPDNPGSPPRPSHPIELPPTATPKPAQPVARPSTPRPMPSIPRTPMPRVRMR